MFYTIIIFIIVLSVLVLAHEFGHFIVARKRGVKVEEFGIGFPPRLWKIKRGETVYSINWIPLGGFVKLKGEGGEDKDDIDSFAHKRIWERALIISAGVIMNIILAAVLLGVGFIFGIPQAINEDLPALARVSELSVIVVEVLDNSPAKEADLQLGDAITAIGGQEIFKVDQLKSYVSSREGEEIIFNIKRGEEELERLILPVKLEEEGIVGIGVGLIDSGKVSYPWYAAFWQGLVTTLFLTKEIIVAFYYLFKNLIFGQGLMVEAAGPVGIAVMTGKMAKLGIIRLLQFISILSINLAILNFLPFPALDGGRFLFLIIEKLRGKPVDQRIENIVHNLGFILLMALVVLVTYRDILNVFNR